MKLDVRTFFTPAAVAASLQRLPELKTPAIDFLFPESARVNHPLPTIGYEDLGLPAGAHPVVRRGSASIGLRLVDSAIKLIEPQPVNVHTFLDAATMNTLGQMPNMGVQQLMDNRINSLRTACRATAEALACQVITGKINYAMKADGANLTYQVDFGTPGTVAIAKKWDDAGTKLSDIIKSLGEIKAAMKGYGTDLAFMAGFDVYGALADRIAAVGNSSVASISDEGIKIGNLLIKLFDASYLDPTTGTVATGVPAKKIVAFDRAAGHKLFYASVDDLDADFAGMPFFSKPIKSDDPSGYKILGASKPLPVVNTKAIITAQVLA